MEMTCPLGSISFISKCRGRLDCRGPSRRTVAGQNRDQSQKRGGGTEGQRVSMPYLEQHSAQGASQQDGAEDAKQDSQKGDAKAFPDDEGQNVASCGSEGGTDSHLPGSLCRGVADDSVDPD